MDAIADLVPVLEPALLEMMEPAANAVVGEETRGALEEPAADAVVGEETRDALEELAR